MLLSGVIFISDSVDYRDKRFNFNLGATQVMVCSQMEVIPEAGGRVQALAWAGCFFSQTQCPQLWNRDD